MTPAARIAAVIEILSELPSGEIASVSAGAATAAAVASKPPDSSARASQPFLVKAIQTSLLLR